jgi:hypothetical protein
MPAEPISVQHDEERGEWIVIEPTHTHDVLSSEPTKAEAIESAKIWATGDASWTGSRSQHISHVVIHTKGGAVQRGWWPASNRIIRVQPLGSDLRQEYSGVVQEFKRNGYERPYWKVEKKEDNRWNLHDIEPTQSQAVESAREMFDRHWTKRLSIYGPDWYKQNEYTHEV